MNETEVFTRCLSITRKEAKNFYFGIRLLPTPKRKALAVIYALARLMDDIADGEEDEKTKLENFGQLRLKIKDLISGDTSSFGDEDHQLWGTYYVGERYPIPLKAFEELLEACEGDVVGMTYETIIDTESYCRKVAGTVGRLSLGIFGTKQSKNTSDTSEVPNGSSKAEVSPDMYKLADDLGVALQLTNILRDIVEDHQMGRIYLPREDLERFGVDTDLAYLKGSSKAQSEKQNKAYNEAMEKLIIFEGERALEWYKRGFQLLDHLDRRSFACTASMAGIYFNLLHKILKEPGMVLKGRLSLSTRAKMKIVARSLAQRIPDSI